MKDGSNMSELPPTLSYATPEPGIPSALKVVAWLFIIGGACSILQIIIDLTHSKLTVNTGCLGVFVGPGLLRFSRGWRTCGLVLLWIGMLFFPIFGVMCLMAQQEMPVNIFGLAMGSVPTPIGLLISAIFFGVMVWEYRVLIRPDVRKLFGL